MSLLLASGLIAVYASAVGGFFGHRRLKARREERAVKDVLTAHLDQLIARVEQRDPPIDDLDSHEVPDKDGTVMLRACYISVPDAKDVRVSIQAPLWRKSGPRRYAIGFKHPALKDDRFPSYGRECRSPWFVERMEKLFGLLDAYPLEELGRAKRRREREERHAERIAVIRGSSLEELLALCEKKEKDPCGS